MSSLRSFAYVAFSREGRKTRGVLRAINAEAAYSELAGTGLVPLKLVPQRRSAGSPQGGRPPRLSTKALGELLFDLASLVDAGTSLRASLAALQRQGRSSQIQAVARGLEEEIASGRSLEEGFTTVLGDRAGVIPGLVASGEASGALGLALHRASAAVEQGQEIKESLVVALSYPAFVLVMSVVAIIVLLTFVVPSLEPILEQTGQAPPLAMRVMLSASSVLTTYGGGLVTFGLIALVAAVLSWRAGWLSPAFERLVLDGPMAAIGRGLIFGRAATVLGSLIGAGVPVSDALRMCARTSRFALVQARFGKSLTALRGGNSLSGSLKKCHGMPSNIIHLAAIGEESGSLGLMIERAGGIEQKRALRQMKSVTQWLGPGLIIVLGLIIGLMMGGLLSAVSGLGDITTG